MERPEALDTGSIALTGFDVDTVLSSVEYAISRKDLATGRIPVEYEVRDTSHRVLRLILGTAKLSNDWQGIQKTGGVQ
jgi:UDP-N-acetylglucosamine 2-epimerase (non-hydrolysing)